MHNIFFIDAEFIGFFESQHLQKLFLSPFFYDLKLLHHHLESFRKLKGKLKKDEEPGWNATRGLRSVRYVLLYFAP